MSEQSLVRLGLGALLLIMLGVFGYLLLSAIDSRYEPDVSAVAGSSLESLKQQNRLTVLQASYLGNVTTTTRQFGLSAKKTLIIPGTVRYEVDLSKLEADDVRWNAGAQTLSVRIPPIEIAPPEMKIEATQTYSDGGLLMAFTDAEARIDRANRRAVVADLKKQADNPTQMELARNAAREAVARSFAMPLAAAGMNVTVNAFFDADRRARNDDVWDLSRPVREVLAERQAEPETAQ